MSKGLLIVLLIAILVAIGISRNRATETVEPAATTVEPSRPGVQSMGEETLISGVHLEALDRETRPQDDFYQFVNGGWLDSTDIPEIYSGYTVYHQVYEDAEQALRKIVETAAENRGENGSESQQVGDIFVSWLDEETINAAGITAIAFELGKVEDIIDTESLVRTMAELRLTGIMVPYSVEIDSDLKDSSNHAVYFEQSGITMPNRDYYIELENENFHAARGALPGYISAMLSIAGMNPKQTAAAAERIYAIEEAIAQAQWTAVDNRDPQKIYNPYTIEDLGRLGANFNWTATREVHGVDSAQKLIIKQPSYFEALDRMITEVPLDDWKAYLTFRVLDSRGFHLDSETAAVRFDYRNRTLNGQQQERPRWKNGIRVVNALVGEAVGKLYVAEFFPPEAKVKMEELVTNVIAALDDSLADLEWMSEETRALARQKLALFTAKIGYPDEWKDYSKLEIILGDHMGNLRRVIESEHQRQIAKLGQPVDRNEWFMTPQTVNAYYNATRNEIVFPAARLQPPFFQLNADDAINYGAVGGVIGHEISHGFDDKGSQFDGHGNLKDWWNEEDRKKFETRSSVLARQFTAFEPVEGMNINGQLTLGENIGDLSGVAMAYRAYINSLEGEEPPVIDGFTGPQRFFIGYAMSRKGKYHEKALINRLASDSHSPLKYRVNGPYRNIDAFHEAWETQEGDDMWLPPEERVRIW